MGQLAPSLAIEVSDPFGGSDPPLRVDLVWRDRKSMRPAELVEQVPALRALVDARRVVQDVAARKLTAEAARAQLARILPRPSWADALVHEVRPAPAAEAPEEPKASPAAPAPAPLRRQRRRQERPRCAPRHGRRLRRARGAAPEDRARGDPRQSSRASSRPWRGPRGRHRRPAPSWGRRRSGWSRPSATCSTSILHHPEVHRLESTWRGLRLLVEHCDRKAGVEVDVVNAGRDGVADALRRLGDSDPERAAIDLVLIDQRIEPVAVDLAALEKWAGLASTLLAPIVLAGHPTMLGVDSLEQVARSTSALSTSDDGRAMALRGVASREASRWVALVLNDPLVRAPYTQGTSRLQAAPLRGGRRGSRRPRLHERRVRRRRPLRAQPRAPSLAHRHHRAAATASSATSRCTRCTIAARRPPSRSRWSPRRTPCARWPAPGLTMLACAPNTDAAVLTRAPVLHRSASPPGRARPSGTLGDQLFVGRFARAVQQVAAAIPVGTDPRAAEEVARIALAEMFDRAAPAGSRGGDEGGCPSGDRSR
jgi:hypothetical protein